MKISELIKKLQSLKEKNGDNELEFFVSDYYSRSAKKMTTNLKCGENDDLPTDWEDVTTPKNGLSLIFFHLDHDMEGKNPKITYRK